MENLTQFGSYQIIRKIGAGGMADVYEAVRIGLEDFQTRVALKCILPSMTRDERFVKMFINEARLGSQLQHPNIIQIQDFNKVNETYYIAMEYIDGVDLSRIIKRLATRGVSLPPTVVIDLAIQALAGLGYAHEARRLDGSPMNIIHRDIKPSNFLITPGGIVKVGDFGIAKAANSASSHSLTGDSLKGTINYMSPEQIDGVILSPASDLFSVGAIIYEMLTLRPLFDGPTMSATLIKIAMVNIEQDMQLVASRYPGFEPVLRRSLSRDPRDRYQLAVGMSSELHRLRQQLGDGLSLREFLAMHKELFEPYGTQPGEQEEDDGPLSMAITPPYGSDRPDIFRTDPSLATPFVPNFDLDGDEPDGEPLRDLEAVVADEEGASIGPVNFEYYPPAAVAAGPESAFLPSSSAWPEDLSSAAQALLDPHDEDHDPELTELRPSLAAIAAVSSNTATEEIPIQRRKFPMWGLLLALLVVGGALAAWLATREASSLQAGPVVEPVIAKPVEPPVAPPQQSVAPPPLEPAQLVLGSTPPGAQISINGKRIGAITPTTLPLALDRESVTVGLELDGYKPFSQELSYRPGQQLPLSPTLVPQATRGTLVISSQPPGARIFIDQVQTGKQTPATFEEIDTRAPHRIALRLPGHQPWISEVTLTPNNTRDISVTLEPTPERTSTSRPSPSRSQATTATPRPAPAPASAGIATLVLNTVPPDAEVFVDGRRLGEVPLEAPVTAGAHVIEFRTIDGRKRKDISINVADGERRRLVWDFEEEKWKSPR